MATLSRREPRTVNTWPGFVDALAALLMVVIFLLLVFVLAQVFLSEALSGQDAALDRLQNRVDELSDLLGLERQATADLRANLEQVSGDLQASLAERRQQATLIATLRERAGLAEARAEALAADVDRLTAEAAGSEADINALAAALLAEKDRAAAAVSRRSEAEAALTELSAERDATERRIAELIAALDEATARAREAEQRASTMVSDLAAAESTVTEAEQQAADAEAEANELRRLLDESAETIRADRSTIEWQTERLTELVQRVAALEALKAELEDETDRLAAERDERGRTLAAERRISKEAEAEVALLNRQVAALREQLAALVTALDASEATIREQSIEIEDLGSRLNTALASRVQDLSRYRSEFFGRLREVLGDQEGVRIVGDRFVFQSEILFGSGSAILDSRGRTRLRQVADTLIKLGREIPPEIDWVLRVDGHTDRVPVGPGTPYRSNWQLSAERALSVVELLIDAGIPPERLAAAGFGEFQPLDTGDTEAAFRRNRRIELKLTQP